MPANNKAKANDSGVNEQQAKTRLLLALWDMGREGHEVKKSELIKRILQTKEKAGDYQVFLNN